MMLEVIDKVFDKMVFLVCRGIDSEDWPIIMEEYKKKLYNRYSDIDVKMNEKNYDKLYKIIFDIEHNEWYGYSPFEKKGMLITDTALEKIINISNTAFHTAKKRLEKEEIIAIEFSSAQISEMEKLLEQVRAENKLNAEKYISEGIVDFYYASGQSESMSLRIGRYPKKK